MKIQTYLYENGLFTLQGSSGVEAILRAWPWSESGEVVFAPLSELVEGEVVELDVLDNGRNSQGSPNELPRNSQGAPTELPRNSHGKVGQLPLLEKATPAALDYAPGFDELAHYHRHLAVVALMRKKEMYLTSRFVESFQDLERVNKFPRPVAKALNDALNINRDRDWYMNLYRIDRLVEKQRPAWFVAATEAFVIRIVNKVCGV